MNRSDPSVGTHSKKSADPVIIVSADGHVGPPVEQFAEYVEPKYRQLMPELMAAEDKYRHLPTFILGVDKPQRLERIDDRQRIRSGGLSGGWDMSRRLQELDAEGITVEVVYPGTAEAIPPFFSAFNDIYPEDVRWAGTRAYHRWLADRLGPTKGRIVGTAIPGPTLNMNETLDELRFVAGRGFRAAWVPGFIRNSALPPLTDPHYYEPFWAACLDLELTPTMHVGWGGAQGEIPRVFAEVLKLQRMAVESGDELAYEAVLEKVNAITGTESAESPFAMDLRPRRGIWQIIYGGVFDRYPNLKLVLAECRGDWVPEFKALLDARFLAAKPRPKIKMLPSEYFGRNVFIVPSNPRPLEVERRHGIGIDAWMFGADYPHPEGTWPNTLTWLQASFKGVPENEMRAMLGENAIKVYGFDRAWLAGIAARIGPKAGDIIGDHKVAEHVIADFNQRSGFNMPTPPLDPKLVDSQVSEDLVAAAG